jgi:VanZ family protein
MFSVYGVAILIFGLMRTGAIVAMNFKASDKVLHGLVFGGLAVLAYRLSSRLWLRRSNLWHAGLGVVCATIFGVLLEILQFFTTYRSAEFADIAADFTGAILFTAMAVACRLERPNRMLLS